MGQQHIDDEPMVRSRALMVGAALLALWAIIGLVLAAARGEQEPFDPIASFVVPGLALVAYLAAGLTGPPRPFETGFLLGLLQVALWWLQWAVNWPMTSTSMFAPRNLVPTPVAELIVASVITVVVGTVVTGVLGRASRG